MNPRETSSIERLLAVFPHPDDESFTSAAIFAALSSQGVPITLVCATRGEVGEIKIADLATHETLGAVREGELRAAMAAVGVADIRFLDYRDSGMVGTPENEDPRALVRVPEAEVEGRLREIIREVRPTVVVTFGPEGVYGHPDHLYMHRTTTAAVLAEGQADGGWRTPALYYGTVPRERFVEMAKRPDRPLREIPAEQLAAMGTPAEEITTVVDLAPFVDRKWAAMAAHRTQFGDDGPWRDLPREEVDRWLGREHFILVALPWNEGKDEFDPLVSLSGTAAT